MRDDSTTVSAGEAPCACDEAGQAAPKLDRRGVLRAGGMAGMAAGAAAVLAACGSSSTSPAAAPASSTPAGAAPPAGGGAPSAAATSAAGGGGGSPLTATSAIQVNSGKIFPNDHVVVTQPESGTFKGFSSTCTHEGCTVSSISGGVISCPCHGSKFSIKDGSVVGGPAPAPLPAVNLSVKGSQIYLQA